MRSQQLTLDFGGEANSYATPLLKTGVVGAADGAVIPAAQALIAGSKDGKIGYNQRRLQGACPGGRGSFRVTWAIIRTGRVGADDDVLNSTAADVAELDNGERSRRHELGRVAP